MSRAWPLVISASFAVGLALGCADRQLDAADDEPAEMPACLIIWGYGHWDDGQAHALVNEEGDSPTICMCMTREEQQDLVFFGEPETFIEHEINKRALDECERVSALHEFDSDPCEEYYEMGEWRSGLGFTLTEDSAYKNQEGLTCSDSSEGDDLGCALGHGRASPAWLLMLAGVLGLRRRVSAA